MTTSINIIDIQLFEDKDHYLAMRQAWKDYIKQGKHRTEGLPCAMHVFYALIRGCDLSTLVAPIKNANKIKHDHISRIKIAVGDLRSITKQQSWTYVHVIAPSIKRVFGDTITDDMLTKIGEHIQDIKL